MAQDIQLPINWKMVHLEDVCKIQTGKKDVDEGNPIGVFPFFTCAAVPTRSDTFSFDGESILLPGNGANVGMSIFFRGKFEAYQRTYVLNQFRINAKYIFYYLQGFWKKHIEGKQYGTAINYVRMSNFTSLQIPLPPLPEQERIVAKIEELFTQLEAGTAALRRIQAGLKRYKASLLKAACEGKLVEQDPADEPAEELLRRLGKKPVEGEGLSELPPGWCWTILGDIASHVTSGSRGWAKYYSNEGDLFLRVGNFDRLTTSIDLNQISHVNAPNTAEGNRTRLRLNDILITITADVGMVGIVDERIIHNWNNSYINQHVGLVRLLNSDLANYVAYALISEPLQQQFKTMQYGVTKKGFNLLDLKSLQIPLPPLTEQRRIIDEVERQLSMVVEIESVVDVNLARSARLRQAILKQAFEGRLC